MSQTNVKIHEVVQQRYGAIASASGNSCCGGAESCCDSSNLYDDKMVEDLPADVTGLSLGCGDPVTIAALQPGESVLDLGSGGGIDCFLAARQVGEAGYVIGVDMTPAMLEKADANKTKLGLTNVEFRQGQIEELPVGDNTIDIVMSNCVINLSPDKPAVFREVFRVLKPGGRASISDIVTEGEFSPELRGNLGMWAECVTGAIDIDEYSSMMRKAGFVNIQVLDKVDANDVVAPHEGMPRIFSARITAHKPM